MVLQTIVSLLCEDEVDGRINVAGASTYHLNSRAVPWNAYNQQLEKFNILVKAKNFLVFQGDVEGVASQDSKALAKLIDRISGCVSHQVTLTDADFQFPRSRSAI
jgi:structural maintenance of chromosome 1